MSADKEITRMDKNLIALQKDYSSMNRELGETKSTVLALSDELGEHKDNEQKHHDEIMGKFREYFEGRNGLLNRVTKLETFKNGFVWLFIVGVPMFVEWVIEIVKSWLNLNQHG